MRNSSLVEWICAENITGLKPGTEAAGLRLIDKRGEKPRRRKPKVSWVKLIFPGLVDP
jgi:hypothetical protein